jgi:hypothetical protein
MAWLNPARWLAVLAFLVALYAWHYTDKRNAIIKAVESVHTEYTQKAIVQNKANRAKEKALKLSNERIKNDYENQKAINDDLVRNHANRLRDYESALASANASRDTPAIVGDYGPFAQIAGECGRALVTLDAYARRLAEKAEALQRYASSLHLKE